jgi:hypothetical protein
MSIQMPAAEVHALGSRLVQSAGEAEDVGARLTRAAEVGSPLQPAVESFLDCHRAAARAMAGELRWLGSTIATVADSWLELDGSLLAGPGSGGSA